MASAMFERLDFQTPRRPDETSQRVLEHWQRESCALIQERWETLISTPFQLKPVAIQPVETLQALREIPFDGVAASVELGPNQLPGLMVFSGRLARALIEFVLNLKSKDWPQLARFTAGEMAILEILFENIGDALQESWPGKEPLQCRYREALFSPHRTRIFSDAKTLLNLKCEIETAYGNEEIHWLLPRKSIEEFISTEFTPENVQSSNSAAKMAELTEILPLEISVELGTAQLKMAELTDLRHGDILLLNQSVRKPLVAKVGGHPKWSVVPVSVGQRIGCQVVEVKEY